MGLDLHTLRFLLDCRDSGVSFENVVMIGRQGAHVTPTHVSSILRGYGISSNEIERVTTAIRETGWIEPLLECLGGVRIESLDYSSFEGATICQDMNLGVPDHLHRQFSCVFDGGTLEHIFDFRQALTNCMKMLRTGGHFICVTPANNFCGHGFYQFSPELFYRSLTEENGFRVKKMISCERGAQSPWYEVSDPEVIGGRVEVCNSLPTLLMICAVKVEDVEPFEKAPQQSDYVQSWSRSDGDRLAWKRSDKIRLKLPYSIRRVLSLLRSLLRGAFRAPAFRKL